VFDVKFLWNILLILSLTLGGPAGLLGAEVVKLPPPAYKGTVSVEEALKARRSVRQYASRSLNLQQVSQLLWAADGLNDPQGKKRTAPAARAAYAVDLYLVAGEQGVTDLAPGIYRFLVADQALEQVGKGEFRAKVAQACNHQAWMKEAPAMVVITGDYARCAVKNGAQAPMYTHMESGFVAQNLFLQAGALGLGAGIAGGFEEQALSQALKLPKEVQPLLVMPVGYQH
jgi:SagB-type dehydrogenase family enzyme